MLKSYIQIFFQLTDIQRNFADKVSHRFSLHIELMQEKGGDRSRQIYQCYSIQHGFFSDNQAT
jgi:hypothetical protein